MASDDRDNEGCEGGSIFPYKRKIFVAKVAFAGTVTLMAAGAGFAMGFRRSRKKYGAEAFKSKEKLEEDPVKFAQRAFLQATKITLGCFAVGITAVCLGLGVSSASGFGDKMKSVLSEGDIVVATEVDREVLHGERNSEILEDKWEK